MNKKQDSSDSNTGSSSSRQDPFRAGAGDATLPERVTAQTYKDSDVTINQIWTEVLSRLPDNWGKWGEDDEIGTLNYLDGRQTFRGMKAAMRGPKDEIEVFTLQPPYSGNVIPAEDIPENEPHGTSADERKRVGDPVMPFRQPARRDQVVDNRHYDENLVEPFQGGLKFADDAFITRLFLQGSSQIDALAHVWYDTRKRPGQDELADERRGLLYNGYEDDTLSTPHDYEFPLDGLRPAADPENDLADIPSNFDPFSADLVGHPITRTREASKNDVAKQADHGEVGRSVFLDVGRNGPDHLERSDVDETRLEQGEIVHLDDFLATAAEQDVEIEKRDILLIRMGGTEKAKDPDAVWTTAEPGLGFTQDLVEWIDRMEIPLIAADNLTVEVLVDEIDPQEDLHDDLRETVEDELDVTLDEPFAVDAPLHPALITNLGLPIHEIYLFDALAESADEDGGYTMLYVGAPLKIIGGVGAPINPMVVKASKQAKGKDDDNGPPNAG